jgi:hypothetical protein
MPVVEGGEGAMAAPGEPEAVAIEAAGVVALRASANSTPAIPRPRPAAASPMTTRVFFDAPLPPAVWPHEEGAV